MDFNKLTQNNWIAGGGALVTLLSGFMPWFSWFEFTEGPQAFGWLGILSVVAGGTILLLKVLDVQDIQIQRLSAEQLAMVLAALGLVLIVLFQFLLTVGSIGGRAWGMFIGLIGAAATLVGAFLSAQDEGIGIPSADDFTNSGGTSTGGPGTTEF